MTIVIESASIDCRNVMVERIERLRRTGGNAAWYRPSGIGAVGIEPGKLRWPPGNSARYSSAARIGGDTKTEKTMDDRMKQHGHIGWCDLMSDNVDRAREFYTGVLGWDTEVVDVGGGPYTVFNAGDCPVAGLMAKPPEGPAAGAPTAWTSYVTVDDVDARTARVVAAGGVVLAGPIDIPTVGRMAIIQDPTGGVIGIIKYADSES